MKTIKFKTDIKCSGCLAKVKPVLDAVDKISNWSVDLNDPQRTLTVQATESGDLNPEALIEKIRLAGYKAEVLV